VGTATGHLLRFDQSSGHQQPDPVSLTHEPINAIARVRNAYAILSGGEIVLYDATLDELERLPFKDVTSMDVLSSDIPVLAITTRQTVILYSYFDHLEMSAQYKLPEKVNHVKMIRHDTIFVSSNYNFYELSNGEVKRLDFPAGFSLLPKAISIIPSNKGVILSRGSTAAVYSQGEVKQLNIQGAPHGLISPFIISLTGNHIHIVDQGETKQWQELKMNKVLMLSIYDRKLTAVSKYEVATWELIPDGDIISSIEDTQQAICLIRQMDYEGKGARLRQLEIDLGLSLFKQGNQSTAMNKFIEFCASPLDVIDLYPEFISSPSEASIGDEDSIDVNSIGLLTHFLTDARRKLAKLLNAPDQALPYKEGSLTIDLYTDSNHSVGDIQSAVDTALFKCYTLINPGLIGSLIRVENHCDPGLVVKTLKERNAVSELIDFYFKRGLHSEALDMLSGSSPELVVRYLQRLKSDNLDTIFKYSKGPIEADEGYGIQIFIDSPFSDTFDRMKVLQYLENRETLERMFLEYIIIELHEKATIFHTRLAELYIKNLQPNPEDIIYKKLKTFLQTGNYDKKTILGVFPNSKSPSLILLKTFILSRVGQHEDVLEIHVNELRDPELAIQYIKDHNTSSLFVKLILLFQENGDVSSVLQLLSATNTTTALSTILNMIPMFKVADVQTYLTKSIRKQNKLRKWGSMQKNLLDIDRISTAYQLAEIENTKVEVNEDTHCEVCGKRIGGSVLTWDGKYSVKHFGCKKPELQLKLRTMTMTQFEDNQDLIIH
jgi:hypothetical protein